MITERHLLTACATSGPFLDPGRFHRLLLQSPAGLSSASRDAPDEPPYSAGLQPASAIVSKIPTAARVPFLVAVCEECVPPTRVGSLLPSVLRKTCPSQSPSPSPVRQTASLRDSS